MPVLRVGLAGFGVAIGLGTACTIAQAVLLARIVAGVFAHHAPASVGGDVIGLAAVMVGKGVCAGAREWIGQSTSALVRADLRHRLLEGVARLGPQWLSGTAPGQVVTTAGAGIDSLDGYVTRAVPAVVSAAITPVAVLVVIGVADWRSLLILCAVLPLVPLFLALVGMTTKRHMDRQWAALAGLSGQFLDLLRGLSTLKVYGRSAAQVAAVRASTDRYRRRTLATLRIAFVSGLVLDLLATVSVALVAVAVGLRLDHGTMSLEAALVVLLLAPEVFAPLRAVGAEHHATEEARVVVDTATDIIDRAAQAGPLCSTGATSASDRPPDGSVIQLHDVGYTYPGRTSPALEHVDLTVHAGELLVVVGPSGAGKTTLLALILGQVAPTTGELSMASHRDDDRSAVAWVPQRPRPTQDTVADEVRLGDPDLTDTGLTAVLWACRAPAGATATGEGGRDLSAGQVRRVALARALARASRVARAGGTPIVLLDEPTEDLDSDTRAVVTAVIDELAGWAAVVVATHDPVLQATAGAELRVVDGNATEVRRGHHPSNRSGPPVIATGATDATGEPGATPGSTPLNPVAGAEAPAATPRPAGGGWNAVLQSLRDAQGARSRLALACVLGAAASSSGLALTATSVWLIGRASQHPNIQALAIAVVGVRAFALAKALLRYAERLVAHDGALRLLAEVRARVFAALVPLAPSGLAGFRRGDLLRRFTCDVDGAQEAIVRAIVPLAGAATTAVVATGLVALIALPAAGILAAGLLVGGLVVPLVSQRHSADGTATGAAAGRRDGLVTGLLEGLGELAAYGATGTRIGQIARSDSDVRAANLTAVRAATLGTTAAGAIAGITVAGVVAYGVGAVSTGKTSPIMLGVMAVAAIVAFDTVSTLPSAFAALGRCAASLRRVDEVLMSPPPVPDPVLPTRSPSPVTGITATDLTLAPAPRAPPVFVDTDLAFNAGRRVAVVGPSGSGKSSLLAALLRLLPATVGEIGLCHPGGVVPLIELRATDVPPIAAGSLQGDHVFSTTLRDNLRLVAPAVTDDDLDRTAQRVGLDAWIRSLPERWSTQAGADGELLSGGQRQRLLLARALLADPTILILDEPTAHLDAATETLVMADINRSTVGRTLVLSTHRTSLLPEVDEVWTIADHALSSACEVARAQRP